MEGVWGTIESQKNIKQLQISNVLTHSTPRFAIFNIHRTMTMQGSYERSRYGQSEYECNQSSLLSRLRVNHLFLLQHVQHMITQSE